jgi:hypothetical protein
MSLQYERCRKCGHQPLPPDQRLPATCPACGVVLAKVGAVSRPRGRLTQWVLRPSERLTMVRCWRLPLAFWFGVWGVMLILMDHRQGEIANSFLHRPLLVFHEAGHVLFMPFGQWVAVLGGTLGQLLMPLIMAGALLIKNHDRFGAALGVWLLGVSLLDIAPYVYDALQPQLMLLGGRTGEDGPHDWIYLLGSMGMLHEAQNLGTLIHRLGSLVVFVASILAAWEAWYLEMESVSVSD